jgi:hypothetical protein
MRPLIVGLGGTGGNIARNFLKNMDAKSFINLGEYFTFGNVKGVWIDSATQDALGQSFFGSLERGEYPGYVISHSCIEDESKTRSYIMSYYGIDLKFKDMIEEQNISNIFLRYLKMILWPGN